MKMVINARTVCAMLYLSHSEVRLVSFLIKAQEALSLTKKNTAIHTVQFGHYAKKQIFCKDPVIAWSHRSRFQVARKLLEVYGSQILLDYGCGDGTFLAEVHDL